MIKIPSKIEEWIEKEFCFLTEYGKGDGARETAQEILTSPQKYGLIEIEKVEGLVDALSAACSCHEFSNAQRSVGAKCSECFALADYEKLKEGK